ncbi:MAG: cation transporting ATPase C-terminal domain-containing protein [Oscillospiraceae bacterium]|nr:cation transporting ATPase C-terminal domain-containing protein [Oscillospiraceae bacterium]
MTKILKFKGDYKGLTAEEVTAHLKTYGHNSEIKIEEPRKVRFYGVFKHMRLYLMFAAAALYLMSEAVLPGILLLMLALGYCVFEIAMENYCDKKLRELSAATEVTVRAVRDGKVTLVERKHIVQDDLIVLQGGESVPADAHILEALNVTVDESAFSGSAKPVNKSAGADSKNELKTTCVYKGTKVLTGTLIAKVFAIGQDVKIRPDVVTVKEVHHTVFESLITRMSLLFTYVAAIMLVIVALIRFLIIGPQLPEGEASLLVHFVTILLPAFSFAMCVVPVSLSLIVRIYYVKGATSLSSKFGEIKNLRALETLNSVTAVCLSHDSIIDVDKSLLVEEISDNKKMLTRICALSCCPKPTNSYEKAIYVNAAFNHIKIDELHGNRLIQQYAPDKTANYNKMNGNLWDINGARLLCVKGEPEIILSYCKMPSDKLFGIQEKCTQLAKQGLVVSAVAFAKLKKRYYDEEEDEYYEYEDDDSYESDENDGGEHWIPDNICEIEYTFIGLLGFASNVKGRIPGAVQSCYSAGVKVIMITPDTKESAHALARKIGLNSTNTITGVELDKAKADGKTLRVNDVCIFAGITAEQTPIIMELLKNSGEKTAAFGGGENGGGLDVDTLEHADVRIALARHTTGKEWDMGQDSLSQHTTGTTFEVCDLVMESDGLEDDGNAFAKTADTIRESHQMHSNIKRCLTVAISTFAIALLFSLINLFCGNGYVLEAVLISTVAVIIIPALSLLFVNNDADLISGVAHPSAFIGRGEVNKQHLIGAGVQSVSLLFALLIMFFVFGFAKMPEITDDYTLAQQTADLAQSVGKLRSVFLTVFMSGGLAMAWVRLSAREPFFKAVDFRDFRGLLTNPAIVITAGLFLFTLLVVSIPGVNAAFGLSSLNPLVFILSLLVGAVSQLWFDFIKERFV